MNSHTTIIGILCIGVALWILLGLVHVLDAKPLLDVLWPVLFMFIGLLVFIPDPQTRGLGAGMFLFGFLIFLNRSGVLSGSWGDGATVALLALLGIGLIAWASGRVTPPS